MRTKTPKTIVTALRDAAADLARRGRRSLLASVDESVPRRPVDEFIRGTSRLDTVWRQLLAEVRLQFSRDSNPQLAQDMIAFLEGSRGARSLANKVIRDFLA